MKINTIERRLLFELDKKSRQPLLNLARKLRISPQRLDYNLKKMEDEGIIQSYIAVIDFKKIGRSSFFVCCLKLSSMTSSDADRFLRRISAMPECTLAFRCHGSYDMMIGTVCRDVFEAKDNFNKILDGIPGRIEGKMVLTHMGAHHYGQRYLYEDGPAGRMLNDIDFKEARKGFSVTGGKENSLKYDKLELRILSTIAMNAREPAIYIAKKMGCSPQTVATRLRKLEKDGVVRFYSILFDHNKCGYVFYRNFVVLRHANNRKIREMVVAMGSMKNVFRAIELFEMDGLAVDVGAENDEQANEAISGIRDRFYEDIVDIKTCKITHVHKFCYFPSDWPPKIS